MIIRLEFKPQDLWIGVYWKSEFVPSDFSYREGHWVWDIWVCIIPMLPIHIGWVSKFIRR